MARAKPTEERKTEQVAAALPAPVRAYFEAVANGDAEALAESFTPDAVVLDVNRRIAGRPAIQLWAETEVIGGVYEILEAAPQPEATSVLIRFTPPEESEGFRALYRFQIEDDQTSFLDLQYA